MPILSIRYLGTRLVRDRRFAPEHEGAEIAQKPAVIGIGDVASLLAPLVLHRLFYELLDDAPAHIDVAAVFDELAFEDALQFGVGDRFGQALHPAEFEDLGPQI